MSRNISTEQKQMVQPDNIQLVKHKTKEKDF